MEVAAIVALVIFLYWREEQTDSSELFYDEDITNIRD